MINNANQEIFERINNGGLGLSIISLIFCFFILIFIIINKLYSSLSYSFLTIIFISEMIGNIGNICEYEKDNELLCKRASFFLIPFSDIFTMVLFCFYSYCSIELIKKINKKIKGQIKTYAFISLIIAIIYSIIVFSILVANEDEDIKTIRFYFYEKSDIDSIRFIHIGILIVMTIYIFYNSFIVIQFLKEKQEIDKVNSWKIAKLIKILFRYPLICSLYWIFYLPYLPMNNSETSKNKKITLLFKLFSMSFFTLRGILLTLNTLNTYKIEIILQRIWEIYIKHGLILRCSLISRKRKRTLLEQELDYEDDKKGKRKK